jgi:hypothetical protein
MLRLSRETRVAILLSLFLIALTLICFEAGMAILRPVPYQRDSLLGWRLKANFEREFSQTTLGGKEYTVHFSTNGDGLRTFGTDRHAPIRILILGDSFTADPYASNDRMWYVAMTRQLAAQMKRPVRDFYVFAGGAGGYGTYQNLLLSKQLPTINPSLFILQFCSNDFSNNLYDWETNSIVRNQYMRRPFASTDLAKPRYVPGLLAMMYRSALGESHIFAKIDAVISGIQFKEYGGYERPLSPETKRRYEQASIPLTETLLARLRRAYSTIPAVMLNCNGNETGPNKQWKSIAKQAGFIPLEKPSDFLRTRTPDQRKNVFNADGGHLSEPGNAQFGAIAGDEIAALHLLPEKK